jgi:hypothetical protein
VPRNIFFDSPFPRFAAGFISYSIPHFTPLFPFFNHLFPLFAHLAPTSPHSASMKKPLTWRG